MPNDGEQGRPADLKSLVGPVFDIERDHHFAEIEKTLGYIERSKGASV